MGGEVGVGNRSGGKPEPHALERRLARLAARQHGVAARAQLITAGFSHRQIDRRIAAGRLIPIHRGVYAVGHSRLTREGRWMAAVLAAGRGAALSHATAAIHWQLVEPFSTLPHVTTPTKNRRRPGIVLHGGRLPADEITARDGIPVTTVPRTILDLAAGGDRHRLERALAQAEYRRYSDRLSLPDLLDRHHGERGTALIRELLADGTALLGVTRSVLEERFVEFLDRHGIVRPELNAAIPLGAGHVVVDCLWRRQRLIIELDGFAAHGGSRRAFESDTARNRALMAAGWRIASVTWRQLHDDPAALAAEIRSLLKPEGERARAPSC